MFLLNMNLGCTRISLNYYSKDKRYLSFVRNGNLLNVCCCLVATVSVLVFLETERRVLMQEKEKHVQTAPPLRARQSLMGIRFKEGTQ